MQGACTCRGLVASEESHLLGGRMDSEPLVANVFHDRLIGSQPPKDMDDDWILEEISTTTSIRP